MVATISLDRLSYNMTSDRGVTRLAVVFLFGILVGAIAMLFTGAMIGVQLDADASTPDPIPSDEAADTNRNQASDGQLSSSNPGEVSTFNKSKVREEFLRKYNEKRDEEDLGNVILSDRLTEMGQNHSEHMATADFYAHTAPDGTTIQDRFRARGLLPECEYEIVGSSRHYEGAENLAIAYMGQTMETSYGSTISISNEAELAEHLMKAWLNSDGHRKAMIQPGVYSIGLGVASQDGKILVSLEMCGEKV